MQTSYFLALFTKKKNRRKFQSNRAYTTTQHPMQKKKKNKYTYFFDSRKGERGYAREILPEILFLNGGKERARPERFFLRPANVLERKKKTRERIHLHAIEAVEFLARFFTAIRNRRRSCLVNLFFNVTCPKVNNTGRNTGGIGRPVPRLSPIIEQKRVHGI